MRPNRHWLLLAGVIFFSSLLLWLALGKQVIFSNYDGPYYVVVARSFYLKSEIGKLFSFPLPLEYYPAHFPLYPLLIKSLSRIGYLPAAVLINLAATTFTAIVLYEICRHNRWGNPLFIALAWLFWWPRMWAVRSIGSPETLFIGLTLLSLFTFQKQKYWLAGIFGALATLTKSPGMLLFPSFLIASKFNWRAWPVLIIPVTLLLLFGFYKYQTGDFWAYFHSGDNIHLQLLPFRVFDSNQPWVGTFWLEDILWIYLIGLIGIVYLFRKSPVWGRFGAIFYLSILFVSHRDISRYSLPLAPLAIIGLAKVLDIKAVRWALGLTIIPMFFYTLNFLLHNTVPIADWSPFFAR